MMCHYQSKLSFNCDPPNGNYLQGESDFLSVEEAVAVPAPVDPRRAAAFADLTLSRSPNSSRRVHEPARLAILAQQLHQIRWLSKGKSPILMPRVARGLPALANARFP